MDDSNQQGIVYDVVFAEELSILPSYSDELVSVLLAQLDGRSLLEVVVFLGGFGVGV